MPFFLSRLGERRMKMRKTILLPASVGDLQTVNDGGYGGLNALVKHCINEVPPDQVRPTECRAPTATGS
jgi:hypothetical protein